MNEHLAINSVGYLHVKSLCSKCSGAEWFPEKSRWCSIEQVCQGVIGNNFEQFQRLDIMCLQLPLLYIVIEQKHLTGVYCGLFVSVLKVKVYHALVILGEGTSVLLRLSGQGSAWRILLCLWCCGHFTSDHHQSTCPGGRVKETGLQGVLIRFSARQWKNLQYNISNNN